MTPHQIQLVQTSFERVKPIARTAGLLFYERLFTVAPYFRKMFRSSIEEQSRKLIQVLSVAVGSLTRLDQLTPTLEDMGAKHAAYGVRNEDYEIVGVCLLWTLQQGLGSAFTSDVKDAWAAAYSALATAMKRGAMAPA